MVRVRAKIDKLDNKTLVIREVPYTKTAATLQDSITKAGDVVKVKDLAIAADKDVVLVTDPEAVVVTVTVPHNAPIPETDAEEAEEAEK